jgi:putative solute:sodium symporter small subunit
MEVVASVKSRADVLEAQAPTQRRRCSALHTSRENAMADLTEAQQQTYWRYNVTLTTILLLIWFITTYIISGLLAGWLNEASFLGFPLGYYMAAQGSLVIFVIEIAVYAYLMNRQDRKYGIQEG